MPSAYPASSRDLGIPQCIYEIRSSQTWIAPADGVIDLFAMGAAGSGGVALGLSNSTQRALGGQAGGRVSKRAKVRAGDAIVFVMGQGGASRTQSTAGQTNGNDGATTTITGPGISITIPGGKGGLAALVTTALTPVSATLPTGGDVNLAGGLPGSIAASAATSHAATGGGAPNITGTAFRGGNITAITTDTSTGGAGIGGNGADRGSGGASGGGGSGGPGSDTVGGPANSFGTFSLWNYALFPASGSSGVASAASAAVVTAGAGSGGATTSAVAATTSGNVLLGASGGVCAQGFSATSGDVTWAGASGGACGNTAPVRSGKAGDALAFIAFYPT